MIFFSECFNIYLQIFVPFVVSFLVPFGITFSLPMLECILHRPWIFGFISTIWEIWIFCVYKHKKRRLFLVLWLRIWFIVWFKSIFTPAATLWIFEKKIIWKLFENWRYFKNKLGVIWCQSTKNIYGFFLIFNNWMKIS